MIETCNGEYMTFADGKRAPRLRVVVLTAEHIFRLGAGDWVQARKTAEALRSLGAEVVHSVYSATSVLTGGKGGATPALDALPEADVYHFLPGMPVPERSLDALRRRWPGSLLVCSPVYWDSLTHRRVFDRNRRRAVPSLMLQYLAKRFVNGALPRPFKKLPYDLVLANSQAEIKVLTRDYRILDHAVVASVPNAVDPVPRWAQQTESRNDEYLLYPAMFAPRKNQIGFIKAMRNFPHKVVFMGGPLPSRECEEYHLACRRLAPRHWEFLGTVQHGSADFYQVLARARVACLASSCETPGIALLEAACLGARPAATVEGCAAEYFGFEGEYFNPLAENQLEAAVQRAWARGRLEPAFSASLARLTWTQTAAATYGYYLEALAGLREAKNVQPVRDR
ncbi:MAG: glycosyltransferase [Acidobacteria bacterium]|nr:glycosyltransferase [Acidobacteriota bacterium]